MSLLEAPYTNTNEYMSFTSPIRLSYQTPQYFLIADFQAIQRNLLLSRPECAGAHLVVKTTEKKTLNLF